MQGEVAPCKGKWPHAKEGSEIEWPTKSPVNASPVAHAKKSVPLAPFLWVAPYM